MGRTPAGRRSTRAIIAVAALYALLLQSFLAGMTPRIGADLHSLAAMCAPTTDGDTAPEPVRHDPHACCLAACSAPAMALASASAETVIAWPIRSEPAGFPVAAGGILPTGPPLDVHAPRGPPAA